VLLEKAMARFEANCRSSPLPVRRHVDVRSRSIAADVFRVTPSFSSCYQEDEAPVHEDSLTLILQENHFKEM
jgi:hypothetical protein